METATQQRNYSEPPMQVDENIIVQQQANTAVHCVVFVGDFLKSAQKKSPLYRLGGRLFPYPHVQTVPNGVVRRCEITRLKPKMRSIHKWHVPKEQWDNWTQSYVLTNQWDKKNGKFVNIELGKTKDTEDLLYKPLQPSQEIGMIAYREQDGVIHLTDDAQLNTADEIRGAQLFVFPNWTKILSGEAAIPMRITELEDYFGDRKGATQSPQLIAVCDAYLESCAQFREKAREYIAIQTNAMKETEGKGYPIRYDEVAERLFVMCDITREDKLIQSTAKQGGQIETAISLLTQNAAGNNDALTKIAEAMALIAKSIPNSAPESQPPAPTNEAEAEQEMVRASEEDTFVDMTAATVPPAEEPVSEPSLDELEKQLG